MLNIKRFNQVMDSSLILRFLQWIFPIPKKNMKKVIMLFMLFFVASFVYNILLPVKKTIIMYTPGAGSESMAYLKPFFITPGSFLLTALFLSLSLRFNRIYVFYYIVLTFTSYFVLYTFVLNPFREFFALHTLADMMLKVLPDNLHAAPGLIRYWMHAVFYTFAELWGTTVVSLLLWGLVNEISTEDEAKATYALFTIGANSSGIVSGTLSAYLSKLPYNPNFYYGATQWDQSFCRIMLTVLGACGLTLAIYSYFVFYLDHDGQHKENTQPTVLKVKQKTSMLDCFYQVIRSKSLLCITIVVMGYNLVYTLSDFVFVKRVEIAFGAEQQGASNAFLSMMATYTGVVATFLALFVNNLCLRYAGWTATALITPVTFILTGMIFYCAQYDGLLSFLPYDLSLLALNAGAIHICFLRGSKYSVFDATKEMAYIGLTREERLNGKAAIDGIASRFGKSGGSIILSVLLAFLGNDIILTIPYVFGIVVVLTIFWVGAIQKLGERYNFMKAQSEEETLVLNDNTKSLTIG
jgi:AAA family ATP:ADP antiporter